MTDQTESLTGGGKTAAGENPRTFREEKTMDDRDRFLPDRERVIQGLDCCGSRLHDCRECPYLERAPLCYEVMAMEALRLLKAQEDDGR